MHFIISVSYTHLFRPAQAGRAVPAAYGADAAGGGQPNRVNSARIAVEQAGDAAQGAVAASDAFFPFRDGLDALAEALSLIHIFTGDYPVEIPSSVAKKSFKTKKDFEEIYAEGDQ